MKCEAEDGATTAVRLRPLHFRLLWCATLLVRCVCVLYLGSLSRLYWFMAHPYMSYYALLLGPTASTRFKPIGVAFGLIGLAHIYRVSQTIYYSVRLQKLVLDTNQAKRSHSSEAPEIQSRRVSLVQAHKTAATGWRLLFSRRGLFGVESDFFHARFLFREILEYVSQTIQVYNSSILIAKPWINNLYVGFMVLNCWTTPLLQRIFERSTAIERLLCLVCDFVLDVASSMFIPLIIFAPYYQSFDFATYNFELVNLYDDMWFASMVMENQQIFALTKLDFVFKILPHMSIYSCLGSINMLVRINLSEQTAHSRVRIYCTSDKPQIDRIEISPQHGLSRNKLTRAVNERESRKAAPQSEQQRPPGNKLGRWGMIISHIVLFLWGLAILVLHLLATKTSQSLHVPACKQPIRPWFATKYSCSVMNFNCHRNGSTGVSEDAFDYLEESSLVALVISHCPKLRIPASIQRFHNLLGIDIYNSTIVEWREDAAITKVHHPSLTYIIFVHVKMTELPPGVLQPLPSTMTDFEISVSNLTTLPDDLHTRWHPMALFYVEHTHINEFPSTLLELSVDDLSLVGNAIEVIPEFPAHREPNFVALALSHNPLRSLPERLGDTSDLGFLSIDETLVTALPKWVDDVRQSATNIYAYGTPFCLGMSEDERERQYGAGAVLTCSDTNARHEGKYPLEVMAPKRPL